MTALFAAFWGILCLLPALAIEQPGKVIASEVGIFTQLGSTVDLKLTFTDETGTVRTLRELIAPDRATIIVPVYYTCPKLCGLVLDGLVQLLNKLSLKLGQDFSVLAVSFNPIETPVMAKEKSDLFFARLASHDEQTKRSWRFVVGEAGPVTALMDQLGFKYLPDGADFAHSAGIMILTPTGRISQYFTGIDFSPRDVRLALVDASMGTVGSAIDHILLYCFRFDPTQGKYTWAVQRTLQVGGALTLVALAGMYFVFMLGAKKIRR